MTWEDNIFGKIPQAEWLNIGRHVERPNDPTDSLFLDEKTNNLAAKWQLIASIYNNPTMAYFHAFDTEAEKTYRIPIDTRSAEKGLIKTKIDQSERLRTLVRNGVKDNDLLEAVLNDGINLADEVITRTKVAKNELLATGKFTIKENNLDLTVDYGVPTANTAYKFDFSGDIAEQIEALVQDARTNGTTLTGFVCSGKIWGAIRRNEAFQKIVNGNLGAGALVKDSDAREFLNSEFGLSDIRITDLNYSVFKGYGKDGRPTLETHRYFPVDKLSFFAANPAGQIGAGLWGDSPEMDESNLTDAQGSTSALSPYVYVNQWKTKDPAVVWTMASTLFLPVLYNPSGLYIATKK